MPEQICPHCGNSYGLTPEQVQESLGQAITCEKCLRSSGLGGATAARPPVLDYGRPDPRKTSWLVLAALICGAFLLLAFLLMPSESYPREAAQRVNCASHMRQIGQAILLYAMDNQGQFPPRLEEAFLTQQISAVIFVCPSSSDTEAPGGTLQAQAANLSTPGHMSYVYLGKGMTTTTKADAIVLYEPLTNHGNDGANFLFADGHVEFASAPIAQKMIDAIKAGQNPPPSAK